MAHKFIYDKESNSRFCEWCGDIAGAPPERPCPHAQQSQGKYHNYMIASLSKYFVFLRVEFYFLLEINFLSSIFELIIRLPMIIV